MKLMPASNAASRQARAASASTPTPYVSHDPNEISETSRSLSPSFRYRIGHCLLASGSTGAWVRAFRRSSAKKIPGEAGCFARDVLTPVLTDALSHARRRSAAAAAEAEAAAADTYPSPG